MEDTDRLPPWRRRQLALQRSMDGSNRRIEEVVILNYERLGKIFEAKPRKGAKKLSKRELARRGAASEEFDIVLFDESHALKNLTSLRAKFSIKLYRSAKMIFWLSATAGQNPLELGYLAPILAKKTGVHWVELDCEAHRLYKLAWKEFKKALEGLGTL